MYERRLKIFLVIIFALLAVLLGRLAQLQLIHGRAYREQALMEMIRPPRPLPTIRGAILDRRGRPIVQDEPCFEVTVHFAVLRGNDRWLKKLARRLCRLGRFPGKTVSEVHEHFRRQAQRMWTQLAALTGRSREDLDKARSDVCRKVQRVQEYIARYRGAVLTVAEQNAFHPLIQGLDYRTAVRLRASMEAMPWVRITDATRRGYWSSKLAPHLIGLCRTVDSRDIKADPFIDDPLRRYRVGEQRGLSGVEKACEETLRGSRGLEQKDLDGKVVHHVEPRPGKNVKLTIDRELQRRIQQLLSASGKSGAIVVLDVPTADVLAMVSEPGFDLATYRREFNRLSADRGGSPLLNRAVKGTYPPGSTVKPLVLLAGLAEGLVTPDERISCPIDQSRLHRPRCWIWNRHRLGHDHTLGHAPDAKEAIKHSCNVYFTRLGERLKWRLVMWYMRFGFARPTECGIAYESDGTVLGRRFSGPAGPGRIAKQNARMLAIGQGPITVTPLQLAAAIAAVARGGPYMSPRLFLDPNKGNQRRIPLDASPDAFEAVRVAMIAVVHESKGTGRRARVEGVTVAGKTGTAAAPPKRVAGKVVRKGDHAWFVGFAPAEKPKIAFAVLVEYGGNGGKAAAPLAAKVVKICKKLKFLDSP